VGRSGVSEYKGVSGEMRNEDAVPLDLLAHERYDRLLLEGLARRKPRKESFLESSLAVVQNLAQVLAEASDAERGQFDVFC